MTGPARARLARGAEVLAAKLRSRPTADPNAIDCDVLVVGSGYGGAVAAARMAGATVIDRDTGKPRRSGAPASAPAGDPAKAVVWVLERGLEHRPGSFPSRFGELPGEVRFDNQDGRQPRGNVEGLFDLRLGNDVNVLVGNGLGGGSLINAGVMERPLGEVFARGWPQGLDLHDAALGAAYARAESMLKPARLPESAERPSPAKLAVLRRLATGDAGAAAADADLRAHACVSFDGARSAAGVEMAACTRCGDCVSGCNQGAKGSLDTSYLTWAKAAGAELFCGGWVRRLERDPAVDGWIVHWHYTAGTLDPPPPLRARRVVLAAGSLGSTGILLRSSIKAPSSSKGLSFSGQLGRRFSTNGDQIAAVFRHDPPAHAARDEDSDPAPAAADGPPPNIGPTICGLVRTASGANAIAVEEFAIPAPLKRVMGEVLTTYGLLHQAATCGGTASLHPADEAAGHDPLAASRASLEHSSILGLMGDDQARGVVGLALANPDAAWDGGVAIAWPDKARTLGALFDAQIAWLQQAARAIGGTVVPAPSWQMLPTALPLPAAEPVATTVHPLGGCAMADDARSGVVDRDGRVFDGLGGVHRGLAVLDGSIVPRALGINPALTIAALAERAVPRLAPDWGLALLDREAMPPGDLGPAEIAPKRWQPHAPATRRTGFRIREQMSGWVWLGSRRWWAELEVPAMEIGDLGATLPLAQRRIDLTGRIGGKAVCPKLRLYDQEGDRSAQAVLDLEGTLELFTRARPGSLEAICTYLRGAGIVVGRVLANRRPGAPATEDKRGPSFVQSARAVLAALRTLPQWRELVYAMEVRRVTLFSPQLRLPELQAPARLRGVKTLALRDGGNPWRQISELALELTPVPGARTRPLGTLCSDLDYFVQWRELLGSLTAQRDQPSALADLGGLLLLSLRIFLFTHWPQFIPPGDMPQRIAERRPGPREPGGPPPGEKLLDEVTGTRLFRYAAEKPAAQARPVLLIHGLSAAGSTFVHPAIPDNLVRCLNANGRDAWVLELRTSSSLQPRLGPYRFEDAATVDIPMAVDAIARASGGAKVDVIAHCIGAAMLCLAVLDRDQPALHTHLGRVVLSQVGPYAKLSPFNRLRGLIAGFLQDYLGLEELDTRPDYQFDAQVGAGGAWVRKDRPSGALAMADALLSTLPYPPDDGECRRAWCLRGVHGSGHDFRRVRHRADGIIGHTLQLDNVADQTLLALDAIYGWVKTGTLAQVIHIAREGVLTNADGDNESVSGVRLAERFDFPVLLLHGRLNQIFDWQGSLRSYRALQGAFAHADGPTPDEPQRLPGGDEHWGGSGRRQFRLLARYGHQDVVIGKDLRSDVYPVIERFLAGPDGADAPPPAESRFSCDVPWMGPMLGHPRQVLDQFHVNLLVHAGARRAETCCIVLVPLRVGTRSEDRDGTAREVRCWQADVGQARALRAGERPRTPAPAVPAAAPAPLPQREMLRQRALVLNFDVGANGAALPLHYAVLVLYRELQGTAEPPDDFFAESPPEPGSAPLKTGRPLSDAAAKPVQELMERVAAGRYDIDKAVLTLDEAVWRGRALAGPLAGGAALCFAAGSCQFPPALFDKVVAGYAWKRLADELDPPEGEPPRARPQFVLLLGDQVYLDALGNVFDAPGRRPGERARRAYETSWRLPGLRDVARRLPLYPMLDDHEIGNDWQPPPPGDALPEGDAQALRAYAQHQAKLAPPLMGPRSHSYLCHPAGVPLFVIDTRTRRQPRDVAAPAAAHVVDPTELGRLLDWLKAHRDLPAKFIAMPSFLLPVERPELRDAEKLRLDGASGYPATQVEILACIRDEGIRGVVLLGGDAHLSVVTSFAIDGGPTVVAIVSSGLYAPWPFINARPSELLLDGPVTLSCDGGRVVTGTSRQHALCTESGLALVELIPSGSGASLRVTLVDARGGRNECTLSL